MAANSDAAVSVGPPTGSLGAHPTLANAPASVPALGRATPARMRSSVDFPVPLAPLIRTPSPGARSRSTPASTSGAPQP